MVHYCMVRKDFSIHALALLLGCLFTLSFSSCVPQPSTTTVTSTTPATTTEAATPTTAQPTATPNKAFALAGKNLISNGDAESGPGTDGATRATSIPGWTTSGTFNVVAYNSPNEFPGDSTPGPNNRGKNFFFGGSEGDHSSATQIIDLTNASPIFATRQISYTFSAWLGGTSGQNDHVELSAQFLGAGDAVLATATLPKILDSDRQGETELLFVKTSDLVPAGTTKIKIVMNMIRTDGSDNDAYADNLSLTLNAS